MKQPLKAADVIAHVIANYKGVMIKRAFGETSLPYNPGNQLPSGIYFVTVQEEDGENDRASQLHRPDVYRVNMCISNRSFESRFGPRPSRPIAGEVIDMRYDFSQVNKLMPHPVYGWMSYVCVLTPTRQTLQDIHPLMEEAYKIAVSKFDQRINDR